MPTFRAKVGYSPKKEVWIEIADQWKRWINCSSILVLDEFGKVQEERKLLGSKDQIDWKKIMENHQGEFANLAKFALILDACNELSISFLQISTLNVDDNESKLDLQTLAEIILADETSDADKVTRAREYLLHRKSKIAKSEELGEPSILQEWLLNQDDEVSLEVELNEWKRLYQCSEKKLCRQGTSKIQFQ